MSRITASVPAALAGLLGLLLAATSPQAAAQPYKVVDPDGRVTYTDRPSISTTAKVQTLQGASVTPQTSAGLPYELRQVSERYPVTLYTRGDCTACDAARTLLRQRGIPYAEKTVGTDADALAFQRTEASSELPVLRIGTQQLRGYAELEWTSYLDAAGYPKTSRLPSGYRGWEPQPLAGLTTPKAAAPAPRPAPPSPPAALPPALEATPSGIRF